MFSDTAKNILNPSKLRELRNHLQLKHSPKEDPEKERIPRLFMSKKTSRNNLNKSCNRLSYPFQKLVEESGEELSNILLPSPTYNFGSNLDISVQPKLPSNFKLKIPNFNYSIRNKKKNLETKSKDSSVIYESVERNPSEECVESENSMMHPNLIKGTSLLKSNDSIDSLVTYQNLNNKGSKVYEFKIGTTNEEEKLIKYVENETTPRKQSSKILFMSQDIQNFIDDSEIICILV